MKNHILRFTVFATALIGSQFATAATFAKTRVRQDAERSLRDAGAPRGEISVP
ncbi:MAG: hypothetical protein KGQ89_06395 [Verrucomicrobia bacterium]|nr:hypothetical protein [Verrucomicrobiota bacterium]